MTWKPFTGLFDEQLRAENAALKEQIEVSSEMFRNCAGRIGILNVKAVAMKETIEQQAAELEAAKYNYIGAMADCKQYVAMIEQQAEAIRMKDAALANILGHDQYVMFQRCPDCDYNCAGICKDMPISEYGELAKVGLAIQPSPEILQARDEKVAEACAKVVDDVIDTFGIHSLVGVVKAKIRSGEWRKYL